MSSVKSLEKSERLIITAASKAFAPSLLAPLGPLNLNWPQHPPVLVYDIGLDEKTLATLREHNIPTKKVPPFCPHWRRHLTWKIWCWNDAPARDILWMDAGLVVQQPAAQIFDVIERLGYFAVSTSMSIIKNASEAACIGCGVDPAFRNGKMTLSATLMGFHKQGYLLNILQEALNVALNEEQIVATEPLHRHDQAIISLLMFKHLGDVVTNNVYIASRSPHQKRGQKIWIHRRSIRNKDLNHFISHISTPGKPHLPQGPYFWRFKILLYLIHRWLSSFHKGFIYDGVRG